MPWKTENNQIVVTDGHPVWIYDDGKESPFDAGSALQKIGSVTSESIARKTKIKELETRLSPFQDIEKPDEFLIQARQAMDTVKNFKDKDYIAANEVEQLKKAVAESYDTKIRELEKGFKSQVEERDAEINKKNSGIHQLVVKSAFDQSAEFIKKRTVLTPDLAFDSFGRFFSVDESEGQLRAVAVRPNGDKIFSLKNPGSHATPEEALEILISERKDRDAILRGTQQGSGSTPNYSGSGSGKSMSRNVFESKNPVERHSFIMGGGTVTD